MIKSKFRSIILALVTLQLLTAMVLPVAFISVATGNPLERVSTQTPTSLVNLTTWVGDGTTPRTISGVGFQPDMVWVKGDNNVRSVARTSTMSANDSSPTTGTTGFIINSILSFNSDGFEIDGGDFVNQSGVTYYAISVQEGAGEFTVGTYTGDGVDGRNVTGLGFDPDLVAIFADNTTRPFFRTSDHVGDASQSFADLIQTNRIQAFVTDGFQLGNSTDVNQSGITYHFFAAADTANVFSTFAYTGDAVDNRSITGAGFTPDFSLTKAATTIDAAIRYADNVGDSAPTVQSANAPNRIQAFQADGFQVGTDTTVNSDTVGYVAFSWQEVAPIVVTQQIIIMDAIMRGGAFWQSLLK